MKRKPTVYVSLMIALSVGLMIGVGLQTYCPIDRIAAELGDNQQWYYFGRERPATEDVIPQEFQGRLSLFILAGQSNIAGRGKVPEVQQPNPHVFVFGNDYRWRLALEPVDDPAHQVDKVSADPDAGYGPGYAFATALLERQPALVIGLIPCARGGSSMLQWQPSLSDNTLYGSCLKRVRAASVMGRVAGILFFQGEAEAIDPAIYTETELFPHEWRIRFEQLVNHWRTDLGLPELPVVFAQIGRNTRPDIFINWELVKEQQRLVQLPYCDMITTDDLALKDAVHFTTESYQIIGQRFADAYLKLNQER